MRSDSRSKISSVVEAGNAFIAHSVRDLPVDDAFLTAMKRGNQCYSPTLMREVSTFVYDSTPSWANDPFFRRGYGADVSTELADAGRQAKFKASPAYAQGLKYKAGLEVAKANLKRVHDAGIRVAMGTDTGPAGRFQGFFEHMELEMMVASGLTPMQAIVTATLDLERIHRERVAWGLFRDRRPDLYHGLLSLDGKA